MFYRTSTCIHVQTQTQASVSKPGSQFLHSIVYRYGDTFLYKKAASIEFLEWLTPETRRLWQTDEKSEKKKKG